MNVTEMVKARVEAPDGPVGLRVWPAATRTTKHTPVLLACHGWTDSGEVFGPLAEALGRRWTVVAPDAPAHGRTPLRPGDYVVGEHAVGAIAVLDALPQLLGVPRVPPVVVLGHSMGALTAARVAAARPRQVTTLILEDPARVTGKKPESSAPMLRWLEGLRSGGVEGMEAWVADHHPDWPVDERHPWARSKNKVDLAHLARPIDWGESLPALLAEVEAPVVLVHGERERGGIVSPKAARRCAATCRAGCRVIAVPAGHCPRRETRARFVEIVAEALARAD